MSLLPPPADQVARWDYGTIARRIWASLRIYRRDDAAIAAANPVAGLARFGRFSEQVLHTVAIVAHVEAAVVARRDHPVLTLWPEAAP